MTYLYIAIAIIAILVVLTIIMYNKFVSLKNAVKEAFSTMDVYLKKRWDLIPNLVECVKGYAKHEQETLENIISLRNTNYDTMNDAEKIEKGYKVKEGLSKLVMLSEAYPELKANENFIDLSKQLVTVENDIENARKYYNGAVKVYNTEILKFPNLIFSKIFNFKEEKMFEIDIKEKENVKVEF